MADGGLALAVPAEEELQAEGRLELQTLPAHEGVGAGLEGGSEALGRVGHQAEHQHVAGGGVGAEGGEERRALGGAEVDDGELAASRLAAHLEARAAEALHEGGVGAGLASNPDGCPLRICVGTLHGSLSVAPLGTSPNAGNRPFRP